MLVNVHDCLAWTKVISVVPKGALGGRSMMRSGSRIMRVRFLCASCSGGRSSPARCDLPAQKLVANGGRKPRVTFWPWGSAIRFCANRKARLLRQAGHDDGANRQLRWKEGTVSRRNDDTHPLMSRRQMDKRGDHLPQSWPLTFYSRSASDYDDTAARWP